MSRLADHVDRNKSKSVEGVGVTLREVHHGLMSKYGWINFNEFKALPLPTLHGLLIECMKEAKAMEESMQGDTVRNGLKGGRGMSALPSRPR